MIDYVLFEKYVKDVSILFVEDDEHIRKETEELLKEIFCYIEVAVDGKDAIQKYTDYYKDTEKYFDIVLTDIKMPQMDGLELTKQIYIKNPEQKIIVLSAHSETKYLLEFVNIGISQYLLKPLHYDDFIRVMFNITKEIYESKHLKEENQSKKVVLSETLYWNKNTKQLLRGKEEVKLTKKEFLLVELLLKVIEKTHSIEEIISVLWEGEYTINVDVKNLKNIVSRLRKKVPDLDIENVYSFGYKINIKYME